jgi:hypothetical protein
VLRYEHETQATMYRAIVLSRNLTYDRSWDVAAHLDGEVSDERQVKSQPLAAFVSYLLSHEGFDGDMTGISGGRSPGRGQRPQACRPQTRSQESA